MTAQAQATKTILIVEDNDIAREGLAVVLRREGYTVITLANGRSALDCLRAGHRPDLILLDLLMPGMDGWEFLAALRKEGISHSIPIIITTGTMLTPTWAASSGASGFLRKPIERDELLAEVQRCLPSANFHI